MLKTLTTVPLGHGRSATEWAAPTEQLLSSVANKIFIACEEGKGWPSLALVRVSKELSAERPEPRYRQETRQRTCP